MLGMAAKPGSLSMCVTIFSYNGELAGLQEQLVV
jgi:hypothetical protein